MTAFTQHLHHRNGFSTAQQQQHHCIKRVLGQRTQHIQRAASYSVSKIHVPRMHRRQMQRLQLLEYGPHSIYICTGYSLSLSLLNSRGCSHLISPAERGLNFFQDAGRCRSRWPARSTRISWRLACGSTPLIFVCSSHT